MTLTMNAYKIFLCFQTETRTKMEISTETTYLLDKVIEQKKLQRERDRLTIIRRTFLVLDEMSDIIFFKDAFLFGTIIKPFRFFNESDVDIGFNGLSDKDYFKAMAYLSNCLNREVDIIQLERHRLSDKIVKEGMRWMR